MTVFRSIRFKLILIILGVSLTGLLMVSVSLFLNFKSMSKDILAEQLTTLSRVIGESNAGALAFDDEKTAHESLNTLNSVSNVNVACLYDAKGQLFAFFFRENTSASCAEAVADQAHQVNIDGQFAEVQTEIIQGGQKIGIIYLKSSLDPMRQFLGRQLIFVGVTVGLAALLTVLLAWWQQRVISNPILEIRNVADTIEQQGSYELRATHTGEDELGQLATAFNRMLDKIEFQNFSLLQASEETEARMLRIESHQRAISELATMPAVLQGNLDEVIRHITERYAVLLAADRVGVWMFNDDETQLICRDLYLRSRDEHQVGMVLNEAEFLNEFEALKSSKYIDAHDALTDLRTAGYVAGYLLPNGIASMLDVGIQAGSRHYGVLCFEHVGVKRHWHPDEISFAMEVADQIAITIQNTLRAEAESALRKSEAYNKLLFSESRIPLVVMDPVTGRIIDCNEAAVDIYQLGSRENVIGKTSLDVSTPTQYDGLPSKVDASAMLNRPEGKVDYFYEWRHQRPSGEIWDAEVHLMTFKLGDRTLIQYSLADITARKKAEYEIKRLNEELEERVDQRTKQLSEANVHLNETLSTLKLAQSELVRSEKLASLGSLVAGVAHELNTPLGNSLMMATSLAEDTKALRTEMDSGGMRRSTLTNYVEQAAQATDLITRNIFRANEMIGHFKQVAVDQASEQRRSFDLKKIIEETLQVLKPSFKNSTHNIELIFSENILLDSYPGPIGQVITNLVLNALMHAFEGCSNGVIRIEGEIENSNWACLKVTDNGSGISPEHLNKIFDPFFTTRLGRGGSGLGLHIVYSIVTRLLGGTIDVQSVAGKGTEFALRIPLSAPIPVAEEELAV